MRTRSEYPWCSPPSQKPAEAGKRSLLSTCTHPVWLGRSPLGLAVAGPMTGQANCRGLNCRAAQGFEHPTQGSFPTQGAPLCLPICLGWARGSVYLLYLEPQSPLLSCDSRQLTRLSPPCARRDGVLVTCHSSPAVCQSECCSKPALKVGVQAACGALAHAGCWSHAVPGTRAACQCSDQDGDSVPTLSSRFGPRRE